MARPPSSALLSILAVLATASLGSPKPLPFLCPFLNYNKRDIPYTQPTPTPTPSRIPNKFIQCDDGLWRRVESYTLYGSTFACSACPPPTQVASSEEDLGKSPSSIPVDDIRDSLPLGWNPTPKQNESRSSLILVLSLVLAFLICAFIIGCVFWRKKIIKQRRRDLEAEFKKHHSVLSLAEEAKNMVEKESKAKLKIWARATARWKANVRHHAARQRKGKRVASSKSSQAQQPSHTSNNSRSRLTLPLPSSIASRRSSFVSLSDELPQHIIGECPSSMSLPHDTTSTPTISPHANAANSPPAYHHDSQAVPIIYSNISHTTSLDRTSSSLIASIEPHNSTHAAHVATDDKTLLARLADLASRPPEEVSADTLDACDILVSAPAWHDELEEIPPDLITSPDRPTENTCLTSSLFPPPPSKERLATADLYNYSFSFEDTAALEPEPSAPPFHLGSAPALDDHQIVPSAPPLLDDTEFLHPSAPQFDVGEQNPVGQDHDRTSSASGLPSPANFSSSSASRQDIITLPGYRP